MPKCEYCGRTGEMTDCNRCKRVYCNECWNAVFINNNPRNCVFCAKVRVNPKCDGCRQRFDTKNIVKKCDLCKTQYCSKCVDKNNHGNGVCGMM